MTSFIYHEECVAPTISMPSLNPSREAQNIEHYSAPILAVGSIAIDAIDILNQCLRNGFTEVQDNTKQNLLRVIRWRQNYILKPFMQRIEQGMNNILTKPTCLNSRKYHVTSSGTGDIATVGEVISAANTHLNELDDLLDVVYLSLESEDWDMAFWDDQFLEKQFKIPTRDPRDLTTRIFLEQLGQPTRQNVSQVPHHLNLFWMSAAPSGFDYNNKQKPTPLAPAMQFVAIDEEYEDWVTGATQPKSNGWDWINRIHERIRAAQLGDAWKDKLVTSGEAFQETESNCLDAHNRHPNGREASEICYHARLQALADFHAHSPHFIDMRNVPGVAFDGWHRREPCCYRDQALFSFDNIGNFQESQIKEHIIRYVWARRKGNVTACAESDVALQVYIRR